jgi:hypothetical protein
VLAVEPRRGRRAVTRHPASSKDRWRLSRHTEGRIHYQTGRGPRCLAVTYAVAGGYVLLRLPEYNDVTRYAPGRQVVLEVADDPHLLQVRGVAHIAGRQHAGLVEQAIFPEPMPAGVATRVICVPFDEVAAMPALDPTHLEMSR